MNNGLVKGTAAALRVWYRHTSWTFGKRLVWHHGVSRLLRTGLSLRADTRFGARMNLRFPDTVQSYVYFFGVWEPAITDYLLATLRPGDIVIDIGANVGYDSLLAAHCVGAAGQVFAIEASPSVFRLLQDNLALNQTGGVTAINAAVCAEVGPVAIYLHDPTNLGGSTIVPSVAMDRSVTHEAIVRGAPLSDLVPPATIRAARLIKIDVEGAEWPVVQGFAPLLSELSPRTELLIEVNAQALRNQGSSVAAFVDLFRAAGFAAYVLDNPYCVDAYLKPPSGVPVPLRDYDFDQRDLLFRRVSGG